MLARLATQPPPLKQFMHFGSAAHSLFTTLIYISVLIKQQEGGSSRKSKQYLIELAGTLVFYVIETFFNFSILYH